MKSYMGHFGQTPTEQIVTEGTLFTTTSSLAEKSIETTLEKAAQISKSKEIQDFIRENNLEPYLKDVNKEGVKNILALLGLIWMGKIFKSPAGLITILALGGYVLFTNKEKIIEKASQLS